MPSVVVVERFLDAVQEHLAAKSAARGSDLSALIEAIRVALRTTVRAEPQRHSEGFSYPKGIFHETILDVEAVMEKFDVSRATVKKWFKQGLEGFRLNRLLYTSLEAIERFSAPVEREPFVVPTVHQPRQLGPHLELQAAVAKWEAVVKQNWGPHAEKRAAHAEFAKFLKTMKIRGPTDAEQKTLYEIFLSGYSLSPTNPSTRGRIY